jgi:hypothetical protein
MLQVATIKEGWKRMPDDDDAVDDDATWDALFADPLTPQALDELAREAIADDDAGLSDDITGDRFLS